MEDLIRRQDAIHEICEDAEWLKAQGSDWQTERIERDCQILASLPSAHPTLYGYDIDTLQMIANVLTAKGLTPEAYADLITDTSRVVQMVLEEQRETFRKAVEDICGRLN